MERIDINTEHDVVLARTAAREISGEQGFSVMTKTRVATAVSELARNVFLHGEGGYMEYEIIRHTSKVGIRCVFIDDGPGIPDIDQAMEDGFSSIATLGHGLPGARRLVDEFDIKTGKQGRGLMVEIIKWN